MQLDLHPPDVLEIDLAPVEATAVPIGRKLNGRKTIAPFEPGIPRRLPRFDATEERPKRLVQTPQGGLTARKVRCGEEGVGRACGLQLSRLFAIGHAALLLFPRLFAFRKRIVVEPPMRFKHDAHRGVLLTGWVQPVFEGFAHGLAPLLLFDVLLDDLSRDVTATANGGTSTPQRRQALLEAGKLLAQHAGCVAFERIGEMVWRFGWRGAHQEVNMIRHHLQPFNRHAQRIGLFVQEGFQPVGNLPVQHLAPVLRAPDNVIVQRRDAARVPDVVHRTHVLSIANHSMHVKYLRETDSPALPLPPKGGQSPRRGVGSSH
ncbi:hypothetical protein OSCT_0072 [Oscillochloris trichoides DG-6]|uniref:Uncharacterized protein n=1 Tax=Oscillochloris trichoides DG-6 TaxID=765420 RepID=E1I9S1_9CHLR|nr:hypothetical protein OSCT_0072 [Oscillochloris trichoides DG-6]